MRRSSVSALLIAVVFGLVLLIGYAAPGRKAPITNQPPVRQQVQYGQSNLKMPAATPQNAAMVDRQKSDNIHKQLTKMAELNQVGVIVTGNTALVGYSPSRTAKDVNATKTMIANKVKQIDPSIKNVVVSESADILARINKLTTDIANNRSGSEIGNEVNQLLKSAAPAVK